MRRTVLILAMLILSLAFMVTRSAQASSDAELPDVVFIEGIRAYGQTYPLSCESRSAADLAGYWGVNVKETEFFDSLPKSDNPEEGFVGSVFGAWGQTPPKPYGVHAPPIAELLQSYGLDAKAHKNMTLDELKTEIANGRPVIVWVVGHVWKGIPQEYKAKDGSLVTVAPYEHTMLAYGYDLAGIYLIDAGNGMRRGYSYKIFTESWTVLGYMAVTAAGSKDNEAKSRTVEKDSPDIYTVKKGDYLTQLAREWGIDWRELAALNNINWPYTIHPGQTLITDLNGEEASLQERAMEGSPAKEPDGISKIFREGGEMEWSALETYIVQNGEHLVQIAEKLQLSWTSLAKLNNLSQPYDLVPGQVLLLPDPETNLPASDLDGDYGESPAAGREYVVQKGDYLFRIAKKFGVNWHVLADVNRIGAPYFVYPGQLLFILDSQP
jgi:LysM repeat protein/uncharacterized protein YvpB